MDGTQGAWVAWEELRVIGEEQGQMGFLASCPGGCVEKGFQRNRMSSRRATDNGFRSRRTGSWWDVGAREYGRCSMAPRSDAAVGWAEGCTDHWTKNSGERVQNRRMKSLVLDVLRLRDLRTSSV